MPARFSIESVTVFRGPPLSVVANVFLSDPPFQDRTSIGITDATVLATIAGADVMARIVSEVNVKLPGRVVT